MAGRLCGDLVRQALPEGGALAVFVGDDERENSRHRIEGLIDALKEAKQDPSADFRPPTGSVEAGDYTIVDIFLDGNIAEKCKENAGRALEEFPDLKGFVTLYGYNAPACLEALAEADKLGKVKVVAFDEYEPTLQGIDDGHVFATVVQDEFKYGYEAVRLLADLARSDDTDIPLAGSGSSYLPVTAVTKDNLAEHRAKLPIAGESSEAGSKAD
jgi:ribose transport system substrate-binding protein